MGVPGGHPEIRVPEDLLDLLERGAVRVRMIRVIILVSPCVHFQQGPIQCRDQFSLQLGHQIHIAPRQGPELSRVPREVHFGHGFTHTSSCTCRFRNMSRTRGALGT